MNALALKPRSQTLEAETALSRTLDHHQRGAGLTQLERTVSALHTFQRELKALQSDQAAGGSALAEALRAMAIEKLRFPKGRETLRTPEKEKPCL